MRKTHKKNLLPLCIFIYIQIQTKKKGSFFSKAANLLLHRRGNWFPLNCWCYHMHMRMEVHSSCNYHALQAPFRQGKRKKLGWQHSTRNRLALSSSLSHIMQIASLLALLLYWHYWRLRESQNNHLFSIQKLQDNCSFICAAALHACCTLGFQWENQNCEYIQDLGTKP